jgi:hypothetical protein
LNFYSSTKIINKKQKFGIHLNIRYPIFSHIKSKGKIMSSPSTIPNLTKDELYIVKLIRMSTDVVSADSLYSFSGITLSRVQEILKKLVGANILDTVPYNYPLTYNNLKFKTNKNLRDELDEILKPVTIPDKLSNLTEDEKLLLKEIRTAHRDPTISDISGSIRKSNDWVKKIGKQLMDKGVISIVGVASRKNTTNKKKSSDAKPTPQPEEKYRSNPILRSELDKFFKLKKSK